MSGAWRVDAGVNATASVQSDVMGLAPFSDAVLAYAPAADDSMGISHGLGGGRIRLTLSSGSQGVSSASAMSVGYERGRTMVRVSAIAERGTVMGYASSGALGLGRGADTTVLELRQALPVAGGWSVQGYGSVGSTRLLPDPASLVIGSSTLVGTRLGLQADGPALGGILSLGLAQPLFVERGIAHLTVPSGYDLADRSLAFTGRDADLSGDRRPLQLTAGFARGGPRSSLALGIATTVQGSDTRATASWGTRF